MKLSHVLFSFAASAVPSAAQRVVFQDGFESGLSGWTATGLWNAEASTDTCGANAAPFPQGTGAAWYGLPGPCNYQTNFQRNSGSLVLNDRVTLPDSPSIGLHFWMWSATEYCITGVPPPNPQQFDLHTAIVIVEQPPGTFEVRLCPDDGPTTVTILPWHERRVDLSAFRGLRVRVGFGFDTVDEVANEGLGWLVDDVQILAEPGERVCPGFGFSSGCPCLPAYMPVAGGCRNSTQQSAVLFSSGSVSVAGDTLQFRAENMPPTTIGLLSQASTQGATVPFGDGLTCTGAPMSRLGAIQASNGVATWPAPGAPSISQRGMIPPAGGERFYSVFYRDAPSYCLPATFNLTETQRVLWVP